MDKRGIEKACTEICDNNINMMIPWYLMAAYAYYEQDDPILEDSTFDRLAKKILKDWNEIEHFHKEYLTIDMLEASTFIGEYPNRIKGAVDEIKHTYRLEKILSA